MARKHEPLNFAGSLEVQSQKPLDGRRKVTLIADLTDAASFPYIYKGLDVFCEENSKWYTFLGGDSTDANNWREEGTGGGTSDYSALSNKPKINNVELSGNKSFNDLKIRSLDRTEDVKPYGFENYTVFYGSINNAGAWGFAYDSKYKRFVFIDSIMDLSTSSQTQYRLITETGLEEVVAELFKSVNVANSEPFSVAANSYEVGDYVLHKTSAYEPLLLWRVTKAIASGDTLYSTGANQNIEQVTLGSELKRIAAQGGSGGNANFDIGTVPLGGAGVYEVNALLSNNDSERVRAIYSRGVNGELPDWFSMSVTSGLGTDDFHVATKEYADKEVAKKQDTLVSGTNIKTINGQPVVGSGDLILHQGVGDGLDLNDMPSYNQLEQMINNNALLYIDGNWLVTGLYLESTTAQVVGEYANKTRSYYFDTDFNLDAPMIYGGTYVEGYSTNPNMIVNADSSQPYGEFTRGDGQVFRVWGLDQRIGIDFTDQRGRQQRRNYDMGTHIAVNEEKWVGTYKDDSGTTYQVYSKMIFIPALPATAGVEGYPHGITGIKQILQVYGFTTDGFVLNAPRQNIQDNIGIYQVQKAGNIQIEVGKDRSSKAAYVCLVYAKNN